MVAALHARREVHEDGVGRVGFAALELQRRKHVSADPEDGVELGLAKQRGISKQKTSEYLEARGKRAMQIMQDQEATWKSMKKEKRKMEKKLL